ncbi:MAG: type II CAAX endopeptidase family protein [Clostridia bacterium]
MLEKGLYKTIKIGQRRNHFDKYDAMYIFGGSFLASQVVGTIVLLLTNMQMVAIVFMQAAMFLMVYFYTKDKRVNIEEAIRFKKFKSINIPFLFLLAPCMIFVMLPIQNAWANLLEYLGLNIGSVNFDYGSNTIAQILSVLVISVGPMIGEETVFRGGIANGFATDYGKVKAIVFSALLFTIMHSNPMQIWNPLVMGLILGYVMFKTGSVFAAAIVHFCNNFIVCLLDLLGGETFMQFYDKSWWWLMLIGLAVGAGVIVAIYFINKENKIIEKPLAQIESENTPLTQIPQNMTYNETLTYRVVSDGLRSRRFQSKLLMFISIASCSISIIAILLGVI